MTRFGCLLGFFDVFAEGRDDVRSLIINGTRDSKFLAHGRREGLYDIECEILKLDGGDLFASSDTVAFKIRIGRVVAVLE